MIIAEYDSTVSFNSGHTCSKVQELKHIPKKIVYPPIYISHPAASFLLVKII